MSPPFSPSLCPQTNAVYYAAFEEWAAPFPKVQVLSDQTKTNEVNQISLVFVEVTTFLKNPKACTFLTSPGPSRCCVLPPTRCETF